MSQVIKLKEYFDKIKLDWDEDTKLNQNKLVEEEIRTCLLHSKYNDLLARAKFKLARLEKEFNLLRAKKSKYYRGKMTKQELDLENWQPFQYIVKTKNEVDEVLSYDKDLNDIVECISILNTIIEYLNNIMYSLKGRSWQIKNIITIKQFEAGF